MSVFQVRAEITSKEKEEEDMMEKVQKETKYESWHKYFSNQCFSKCWLKCLYVSGRTWNWKRRLNSRLDWVSPPLHFLLVSPNSLLSLATVPFAFRLLTIVLAPPREKHLSRGVPSGSDWKEWALPTWQNGVRGRPGWWVHWHWHSNDPDP